MKDRIPSSPATPWGQPEDKVETLHCNPMPAEADHSVPTDRMVDALIAASLLRLQANLTAEGSR